MNAILRLSDKRHSHGTKPEFLNNTTHSEILNFIYKHKNVSSVMTLSDPDYTDCKEDGASYTREQYIEKYKDRSDD